MTEVSLSPYQTRSMGLKRRQAKTNSLEKIDSSAESVNVSSVSVSSDEEAGQVEYENEQGQFVPTTESNNKQKSFYYKHEVPRKIFHSITGFWVLFLYVNGFNIEQFVGLLIVLTAFCFLQDFVRFRYPKFNEWFGRNYGFIMRPSEKEGFNGIGFFLIGLLVNCAFFTKDLTILTGMFLSWGDTAASLFGREFGKYTPKVTKNKSLAGFLANLVVSYAIFFWYYGYVIPKYHATVDRPGDIWYVPEESYIGLPWFALIGAFTSATTELVGFLDDNVTIPVLSSTVLYVLVYLTKKI
ncbi:uncharacterized protein RJT20DRAFT_60758 [Scheffersomyces xylosifermentans]|uniref:uncharacterized protein n=1 Tax=Scheffersomyces xylosifermentans TaxID=1304137 RepID=UPI00315D7D75